VKIIGVYNFKGGVGKTTAAVNLAYLASQEGEPVLLMDLDPQGASSYYLQTRMMKSPKLKRLFKGKIKLRSLIKETEFENLHVLPADFSYRKMDLILDNLKKPRRKLLSVLKSLKNRYSWIFIDSPTNISLVSENMFKAVDILLVPVIPAPLSVRTYEELIVFFRKKKLKREIIVPFYSMVQKQKKLHRDMIQIFSAREPSVLKICIPFLSDVEKMGIKQKPLPAFKSSSPATIAFQKLWAEVKTKAG
jgi:chromosome partitioning protein